MKVQRGAFLMLVSAMAAKGCIIVSDDGDGNGSGGSGGSTAGTDGGDGADGSVGGDGGEGGSTQAEGGAEGGAANLDGGGEGDAEGDAGESDAMAQGDGGPAADGGDAAPACDDSVGSPADCAPIASITNCGASSWEESYCNAAKVSLKPAVAEAAVACMLEMTDCYAANPYDCVGDALAGACPDPGRAGLCTDVMAACGSVTEQECHALVDGLSDDGVTGLYSCLEGGCTFGLWSCIEGLQ